MQTWISLCPYCEQILLKDDAQFCNHCGSQLTWTNQMLAQTVNNNKQQASITSPMQKPHLPASVVGIEIDTKTPVTLEQKQRQGGLYVIGKTRSGKTTLLVNLILQDIEQGMGVCFIDPHGDAINDILARLPSGREKDVILLDPFDEDYAFGLNLYQCDNPGDMKQAERTISYVMQVFEKLWGSDSNNPSWGPRMAQVLRNTTITLIENPDMTMLEVPLLFYHEDARAKLVQNIMNDQARNFWNYTYDRMKPNEQREFTDSTYNKIDEFLGLKSIRHIVGQSKSTIDFRNLIDSTPGKILLVKLSKEHWQMTSLIGAIIIGQLANAVYSRSDTSPDERVQFNLYADEYQRFATPDFAELLTEAGKFKIATTIAHQLRGQLDGKNRDATLNAANLVVYQVIGEDADELAKQFDATPPTPEIIGYRPILTPKSDVVDHLKKNGHINPSVNVFVNDYLVPAMRVVEANKRTYMSIRVSPRPGEPKRNVLMSDLDEAINQLNTLLYSVMRDKNAEKPIPPFVFIMFARLFGFSHGYAWYWARWGYFRNEQAPTIFRPKAELLLLCAPDFLLHKDQIAQKNSSHALTPALAFITSLRHVMHILAVDPILIDTGQHEPIYDKPRTYADVQNEIAKRLAIPLQEYSAHCKLGTKEFTIKATQLREADTEAVLLSRKQRIIAQTRGQYCTKRVHVVEEITARQVELLKPIKKERKTKQEAE